MSDESAAITGGPALPEGRRRLVAAVLALAADGNFTGALDLASQPSEEAPPEPLHRTLGIEPDLDTVVELIRGVNEMRSGHYADGLSLALPALTKLEECECRYELAWAWSAAGYSLGHIGDPERGLERVAKAVTLSERRGDDRQLIRSMSDRGSLRAMAGDLELALESLDAALELARAKGLRLEEAGCLNNLAYTLIDHARSLGASQAGEREEAAKRALALAEATVAIASGVGSARLKAWGHADTAAAVLLLGDPEKAKLEVGRARSLAAEHPRIRCEILVTGARADLELGETEFARLALEEAWTLARDEGYGSITDRILESRVALEERAGRPFEALAWARLRIEELNASFRSRVTALKRSAALFMELERLRQAEQAARERIDELSEANRTLSRQSTYWKDEALTDTLTGCLNRRGLAILAEPLFGSGLPLALAILDADHFKLVNDVHGHAVGDRVLRTIARTMMGAVREGDLVARYGGEEFVIVIPRAGAEAATATCERIRSGIEGRDWGRIAPGLAVTVSLGLAVGEGAVSGDQLLERADEALYRAKAEGRNRVRLAPMPPPLEG